MAHPAPLRTRAHPACALSAALILLCGVPASSGASPVLQRANFAVAFTTPTACDVEAEFTVAGLSAPVEHRLHTDSAATVELLAAPSQADAVTPADDAGAHVLHVRPSGTGSDTYAIHYRVVQSERDAYRCPLWLPTVPTDGLSREVHVRVSLPSGATPGAGGFPTFEWTDGGAVASLGHVPAFVHVPFRAPGDARAPGWDVQKTMDTTAVVLLVAGMLTFAWRRKKR